MKTEPIMDQNSTDTILHSPNQDFGINDLPRVAISPSSITNDSNEMDENLDSNLNNKNNSDNVADILESLIENGTSTRTFPSTPSLGSVKSNPNNGELPSKSSSDTIKGNQTENALNKKGDSTNGFNDRSNGESHASIENRNEAPAGEEGSALNTPNTPSDDVSNEEAADNNDDLEPEDIEGEAKGRFNLRKRRIALGSYDGYNDSDLTGQSKCAVNDTKYEEDEARRGTLLTNKRRRTGNGYTYDNQRLLTAANFIKRTGCPIKQAAIDHGIPATTMHRFYKNFLKSGSSNSVHANYEGSREVSPDPLSEGGLPDSEDFTGRGGLDSSAKDDGVGGDGGSDRRGINLKGKSVPNAMNALEEHQLATYISLLSRSGKSISHSDIKVIAQQILESTTDKKKAFRKGNCPTGGWIQKFQSRHPELEYKTLNHSLMKTNTEPNVDDLNCWVTDLRLFLRLDWKLELEKFFIPENANRIYTCDEILIAFSKLDGRGEKIPLKSLLKNSNREEKQLVTVIAAASAAGEYLKPHLLQPEVTADSGSFPILDPSSYSAIHSDSGLITPDIFMQWVQYFDSYLSQRNIKRPVVLLVDDHQAHFHISVFLFCLDKQIIPVCLPPKLNKIIQPLLAIFFPKLMMAYQACCKRYTSKTGNSITHQSFPYIMMKAWTLVTKPNFVTDGFKLCKLIPMEVTSLEVAQGPPSCSTPTDQPKPTSDSRSNSSVRVKQEPASNDHSEEDGDGESSAQQDEAAKDGGGSSSKNSSTTPRVKKVYKKRKLGSKSPFSSQTSSTCSSSTSAAVAAAGASSSNKTGALTGIVLGDRFVSEERKQGRREGIDMCLSVLESFVPADILPVWRLRNSAASAPHTGTCEIGYCMWKAVELLHQGGIDMVGQVQPQSLEQQ